MTDSCGSSSSRIALENEVLSISQNCDNVETMTTNYLDYYLSMIESNR
jgi:hypothetical protein